MNHNLPNELSATAIGAQTFAIYSFGCRTNQSDTEQLIGSLKNSRLAQVDFAEKADVYIINTCTVTQKSDSQARNIIHAAMRRNSDAQIFITGCYATWAKDELAQKYKNARVLSNAEKFSVAKLLLAKARSRDEAVSQDLVETADSINLETQFLWSGPHATVTRPNVKIQDGCNNNCSFCIIPKVRGRERSLSFTEVMDRALAYEQAGAAEIVLTGIHIGKFGYPHKQGTLTDLLQALSNQLTSMRIRLSSVEPEEVTDELVDTVTQSETICDHFHIPLQSGSDRILREMFRRYKSDRYREIVGRIVQKNPQMGIGTDVIVGFPGETDDDFKCTLDLVCELPFTYGHVFPYSDREGTKASELMNKVPEAVKKERCAMLRECFHEKQKVFVERQAVFEHPIVVEETLDRETGFWSGLTSNYVRTLFKADKNVAKKLVLFNPTEVVGEIKLTGHIHELI